ncbi:MAG: hypothetical protein IJ737_07125 [Ruminococcus sp.]|nr:hypothetical protein [Ruminococcus sp.]
MKLASKIANLVSLVTMLVVEFTTIGCLTKLLNFGNGKGSVQEVLDNFHSTYNIILFVGLLTLVLVAVAYLDSGIPMAVFRTVAMLILVIVAFANLSSMKSISDLSSNVFSNGAENEATKIAYGLLITVVGYLVLFFVSLIGYFVHKKKAKKAK